MAQLTSESVKLHLNTLVRLPFTVINEKFEPNMITVKNDGFVQTLKLESIQKLLLWKELTM